MPLAACPSGIPSNQSSGLCAHPTDPVMARNAWPRTLSRNAWLYIIRPTRWDILQCKHSRTHPCFSKSAYTSSACVFPRHLFLGLRYSCDAVAIRSGWELLRRNVFKDAWKSSPSVVFSLAASWPSLISKNATALPTGHGHSSRTISWIVFNALACWHTSPFARQYLATTRIAASAISAGRCRVSNTSS